MMKINLQLGDVSKMSTAYTLKISNEEAKEMPMVDLAFNVLKAANTPFYYRDLMTEIAKIKGISDDEVMDVIAHLYTEINIDGRFACVGTNLWGLKRWYPLEKAEDPIGNAQRPRIINDDDEDEEDAFELETEEDFDESAENEDEEEFDEDEDDEDVDDVEDDIEDIDDEDMSDDDEAEDMDMDDQLSDDEDDESED